MRDVTAGVRMMVLSGLMFVVLLVWLPGSGVATARQPHPTFLEVSFLDVGQGDAIFIETPDGVQVLIDGGPDTSVLRELGRIMPLGDRSIDVVIATHPDKDHIGGLVDVLVRYDVGTIVVTENESETETATAFTEAVGADRLLARRGERLFLGASTTLEILSPSGPTDGWESNNASIIAQLRYGDTEFMLTGDAPYEIEDYLVEQYGNQLESEVLKLGHHGSKTSTSDEWLETVDPDFAVVSAGADNRYGHPNDDVVGRTIMSGSKVVSTIDQGTITFVSDGFEVWIK